MFTGINAIAFNKIFSDEYACQLLLDELKWRGGYCCKKCNCKEYKKGRKPFHRRCRQCRYNESLTANTIFHDIRMPLLKAFQIIFRIGTKKKGMSTVELSGEVGVQQKTAWLFKRKIQYTMQEADGVSAFFGPLLTLVEKNNQGLENKGTEKQVSHPSRPEDTQPEFINFFSAEINKWRYPIAGNQEKLFSVWISGIHHRCSVALFSCYCNEFAYRFKRRRLRKTIFETLIRDMLQTSPHRYALLCIKSALST